MFLFYLEQVYDEEFEVLPFPRDGIYESLLLSVWLNKP